MVLRRMFGCKRDEVIGVQRNLYNEELLNRIRSFLAQVVFTNNNSPPD